MNSSATGGSFPSVIRPTLCAKRHRKCFYGPYRCSSAQGLATRLDLRSAAVNEQFDARDETGVIRSQKQRRSFRSVVRVRTKERIAALLAA